MGDTVAPSSRRPLRVVLSAFLILAPVTAGLAVPLYQRTGPALGGIPFFYWFQMAAAVLTALCTSAVYRLLFAGEKDAEGEE
ncbi:MULTISPECIES: DUF3311 domain-containing protein [Amycolatopsis]|uniref:DUF3311 domain-containing protein n=1 Tax=Amycolatopsis TaxID=1813 RepID=UPI000561318D|nr:MULTISPECIES: DUF3311 domain-containing protein [Amycolatopsis]MCG3754477.1 DUF3311 domain-containing protein [Amycolatopsis sp. Poz14]